MNGGPPQAFRSAVDGRGRLGPATLHGSVAEARGRVPGDAGESVLVYEVSGTELEGEYWSGG